MTNDCGCCDGIQPVTPRSVANRPGLGALAYRVGTHSSFLETMIARLATIQLTSPTGAFDASGQPVVNRYNTLGGLKTHDDSDFSIALLDAWATVADVLTFYQERIANEGYLRTATERRSIVELSRLIDYVPKPGVSASVYLAYTLDKDTNTTIPAGARSQSVPGAGELPQSFETSDKLDARFEWNALQPRSSRPQRIPASIQDGHRLFLQGIATKLKPGDPLIVTSSSVGVFRVVQVKPDAAAARTTVVVQTWSDAPALADTIGAIRKATGPFQTDVAGGDPPPASPPPIPPFVADIQTSLKTLENVINQSSAHDDLDAAIFAAVQQITTSLVGAASGGPLLSALTLWDGLARALLPDTRLEPVKKALALGATVTTPGEALPDEQGLFNDLKQSLSDLNDTVTNLTVSSTVPPASPRDPAHRDRVSRLVVALQTTIERIRLATASLDGSDTTNLALLGKLQTSFTDSVRVFPVGAIWSGLDAIRSVYTDRANKVALSLAAAPAPGAAAPAPGGAPPAGGAASPTASLDLAAVQDTLDSLSTIPPLVDPVALAARIRDIYENNLPQDNDSGDEQVDALIAIVRQALFDFVVSLQFGPVRSDVQSIIKRYSDPDGAGLFTGAADPDDPAAFAPDTAIAAGVLASLKGWVNGLSPDKTPSQVISDLELTLSELRTALSLVQAGGYPRIEPWLTSLTNEIEEAAGRAKIVSSGIPAAATQATTLHALSNGKPRSSSTNGTPQQPPRNGKAQQSNGDTNAIKPDLLLGHLLTAPSVPPRDPSQLSRTLGSVFTPNQGPTGSRTSVPTGFEFTSADVSAQLLVNFDARLKTSLYPALANVPVSPTSQPTSVKAPRIKAAPFGATAPLKPVLEDGKVVGAEEWPLTTVTFTLDLPSIPSDIATTGGNKASVTASVIRDGQVDPAQGSFDATGADLTMASSKVHITTNSPGTSSAPVTPSMTFLFTNTSAERLPNQVLETITVTFSSQGTQALEVTCGNEPSVVVSEGIRSMRAAQLGRELEVTWHQPAIVGGRAGLSIRYTTPDALLSKTWNILTLDGVHDQIVPDSWVVIERADRASDKSLQVRQVVSVATVAVAGFGLSAKATRLTLDAPWLDQNDSTLDSYRKATVYAQTDTISMAPEPYDADISGDTIELDDLKDGLKSGRFVIVSGERTDIPGTGGVLASELAMLRSVTQDFDPNLPGDKLHSYLGLSNPLAYTYKRSSVTIYGNAVKATHGETRNEVLGDGDSSQELQTFSLKQQPLAFVPAANSSGAQTTLVVRVNNVLWSEVTSLSNLDANARDYVTLTDDDNVVTAAFGDGVQGARLPTGRENVRARYRTGTGSAGNVASGQISLLVTRPLGVKSIINPLPASGGADRETIDQARTNAPLSVTALDRLVSVPDYEDFARNFAGIAKASAQRFVTRGSEFVHLTLAGSGDTEFDLTSDLGKAFQQSLRQNGDPFQKVVLAPRELVTVILSAQVRVVDGYLWELVSVAVRQALVTAFGFDLRELGQSIWLSEVYQVIQAVEGVDYVSIKSFGGLAQLGTDGSIITFEQIQTLVEQIASGPPNDRIEARLATIARSGKVSAAQIVLITPDVPDTIILTEIEP